MVRMEIDSHKSARGNDPLEKGNPQKPSKVEAAHKTNGVYTERVESDGPRSQPMVGFAQQEEVHMEDITGKPE